MDNVELNDVGHELLHCIYDAALAPEKWRDVLIAICNHIGADEGPLIFFDAQNCARNFLETAFNNDKSEYLEKFIDTEVEGIKRLFKDCREGDVIDTHELTRQTGQTYEDIQNDAVQYEPRTEFEAKAGVPLIQGNAIISMVGFHRRTGSAELSPQAFTFLKRIAPHITRSIHIHNHVSAIKHKKNSLIESLKNTNLGVFLLDANLCIVFSSPEANRILGRHGALTINKSNKLEAKDAQENSLLQHKLRNFTGYGFKTKQLETQGLSLALRDSDNSHPLKLSILPIKDADQSTISLAIFINDPEHPRIIPQEYLQQAYSFTLTEAQIAQLLLNGCTLKEIAELRNTSIETARSQLKKLMQKSAAHSQAELVRLLMQLSGDFLAEKPLINK